MSLYAVLSEKGNVRSSNEDSCGVRELDGGFLMAIADGIGGEKGGKEAGQIAVDEIIASVPGDIAEYDEERLQAFFDRAFVDINRKILLFALNDLRLAGMGTTLTVALVTGNKLFVAHMGDTRAYLIHRSSITRLTHDHASETKSDDGSSVSRRLLRSLGENEYLKPDFYVYNIIYGDMILLSSDGIHAYLTDDEIVKCLKERGHPDRCLKRLIEAALEAGSDDNVTALLYKADPK